MNNPTLDARQKAVKGLLYVSESEAELAPFLWAEKSDLSEKRLLELVGAEHGTAVEQETLEAFFRTVPPEEKVKFAGLASVLKDQLTGVKVFKIGDEAEKQVVVVGKTTDGKWAGVKTTVIET